VYHQFELSERSIQVSCKHAYGLMIWLGCFLKKSTLGSRNLSLPFPPHPCGHGCYAPRKFRNSECYRISYLRFFKVFPNHTICKWCAVVLVLKMLIIYGI